MVLPTVQSGAPYVQKGSHQVSFAEGLHRANGNRFERPTEQMNREAANSKLPSDLLQAISSPNGGRVVLVLGAGCSKEDPTCLPLTGELSAECYRRLVDDGVLDADEVCDPYDLSAVAEAVFQKTKGQSALIERFPQGDFKQAEPNEGYLIMAALLIEGAIGDALTLNFDLAARSALAHLGAGASVSTVRGPEEHTQLASRNLIYLHRDIESPPDEIILRKSKLDEAWQGGWEQIVAQRVLAGPTVVFVGLGSPAAVLIETMTRILEAIGNAQASVYVVDPLAHEDSRFASALSIAQSDYICMGWGELMRALAQRVVKEHCATVKNECSVLVDKLGINEEDVSDICSRLAEIGLIGLGQLRAAWMLARGSYLPYRQGNSIQLFSDLVLAVRLLERVSGQQARFGKDGLVELSQGSHVTQMMVCSGSGWMNSALVQAELSRRRESLQREGRTPSVALVAGVMSGQDIATPSDIAVDTDSDDIITGSALFRIVSIDELRADPSRMLEVIR